MDLQALDQKVLQPLLLGPARNNQLQKPLLIIAVTDGAPGGEDRNTLVRVLVNASRFLKQTRYGPDAMSVQLAQIGNDMKARAFLEEIDSHPEVGDLVDCTSCVFFFSSAFLLLFLPRPHSFPYVWPALEGSYYL